MLDQIPIKNLYYMLCYAWDVLPIMDKSLHGEEDFDDAYNLLSKIFLHCVGRLIASGVLRDYVELETPLSSPRGRININKTILQLSKLRKELVCNYEEYSINFQFNQIVKYTLENLLRNKQIAACLKKKIRFQLLFFVDVDSLAPIKPIRKKLLFNNNNNVYKMIMNISFLLYDNSVASEETGKNEFIDFYRDKQMHKVFELFILNFYRKKLSSQIYRVHAPKIFWKLNLENTRLWESSFVVDTKITDRRTDIVIENKKKQLQIIFDAKYYRETFVSSYMNSSEKRLRNKHIEQIRGYILDSNYEGYKIGALIYPKTKSSKDVSLYLPIQNSDIFVKTLNLDEKWIDIEKQLLNFLEQLEKGYGSNNH